MNQGQLSTGHGPQQEQECTLFICVIVTEERQASVHLQYLESFSSEAIAIDRTGVNQG